MKADFSEFSYGFALTRELIDRTSINNSTAPIFPSLLEEGRYGGHDVEINFSGFPLFIQFKLSEYMKEKTSKEWNVYGEPYYRFSLRPSSKSQQHDLLLDLEAKYGNVYYAAPAFYKAEEFNKSYFSKEVIDDSVFLSPSTIGTLPDNKEHRIVFQADSNIGYFCSKPRKINVYPGEDIIHNLFERKFKGKKLEGNNDIIRIGEELIEIGYDQNTSNYSGFTEEIRAELISKPLQTVTSLSRILFNCEFCIIKDRA